MTAPMRHRIAILASGNGSNAGALLGAVAAGEIAADVACVVSDVADAGALDRARRAGVDAVLIDPRVVPGDRAAFDARLVAELATRSVTLVVLAGWMRICGSAFLNAYGGRAINVHPSLLPAFPGRDAVGRALAAGVAETGVTVHFIDSGVDTGPRIARRRVTIRPDDDLRSLADRVHAAEHELLPRVTAAIVRGDIELTPAGVVAVRPGIQLGDGSSSPASSPTRTTIHRQEQITCHAL